MIPNHGYRIASNAAFVGGLIQALNKQPDLATMFIAGAILARMWFWESAKAKS